MANVKMITEGDCGVEFREQILDTEWLEGLVGAGYMEKVKLEESVDKFMSLIDVSWMGEELVTLKEGIESVKSQEGEYYVGSNGEYEMIFLVVF